MDRSYALLLLLVRLKQVRSAETALRIFEGALQELWPEFSIELSDEGEHPSPATAGESRFPVASGRRRYGELRVRPATAELTASDRGLLYNGVELLVLFLDQLDDTRDLAEMRAVVDQAVRRRNLGNLAFLNRIAGLPELGEAGEIMTERIRWIEALEEALLESGQEGEKISGGELDAVLATQLTATLDPPPKLSSSFSTVDSASLEVSMESGRQSVLLLRELVAGVCESLWRRSDPLELSISTTSYSQTLALTMTLRLGETEGSPRALSKLHRDFCALYAEVGDVHFQESWEWGSARFILRLGVI